MAHTAVCAVENVISGGVKKFRAVDVETLVETPDEYHSCTACFTKSVDILKFATFRSLEG